MAVGDGIPNYGGLLADQMSSYQDVPDYQTGAGYEAANRAEQDDLQILKETSRAAQLQAEGPPIKSMSTSFADDGTATHKVEMSDQAMQFIQQMMGVAQSSIKEKNALENRLRAQRDVLEKNPAIAQVGKILSLAAAAYQAPNSRGAPLVHAAGAYAGDFFKDSPEELQAQISQVEASKLHDLAPVYAAITSEARLRRQESADQQREARFEQRIAEQKSENIRDHQDTITTSILTGARKGEYTPGEATNRFVSVLGDTPQVRAAAAAVDIQAKAAADNYKVQQEREKKETLDVIAARDKANQAREVALENLRFTHNQTLMNSEIKGAPGLARTFNAIEDDYRPLLAAKTQGIGILHAEQQRMMELGVPGYDKPMNPDQLVTRLTVDYGKLMGPIDEKGKGGLRNKLGIQLTPEQFGLDKETFSKKMQEVQGAGAAYKVFQDALPKLNARYNETRKLYSKLTGQEYPALTNEEANKEGSSPKPVGAPTLVTKSELEAMSLDELKAALSAKRVDPSVISQEDLADLIKRKQGSGKREKTGVFGRIRKTAEGVPSGNPNLTAYTDPAESGGGGF